MTDKYSKLHSCPRCGCTPEYKREDWSGDKWVGGYRYKCWACGLTTEFKRTDEEAIEAWNSIQIVDDYVSRLAVIHAHDIENWSTPWGTSFQSVVAIPSDPDVIKVIRCKNCKYYHPYSESTEGYCSHPNHRSSEYVQRSVSENFYCGDAVYENQEVV